MSPAHLRRYRAERLLAREYEQLRGRVLASVRGRLAAGGVRLDSSDLEACYAQAWQGLYMTMLEGREIANPAGWLVLVTYRRAIEERRARDRAGVSGSGATASPAAAGRGTDAESETPAAAEPDLADRLHDRVRLRQLLEGMRGRLHGREREAAALCYLQGLTRAQAAAQMGVSDARMRKLMEGGGRGAPGVAGKVSTLVETIRDGRWCEQQGSLMRALAYGVLDPDGERYRLALLHRRECPACRAYVLSLRGLAAALPPVLHPWSLAASALARVGGGAHAGPAAAAGSATVPGSPAGGPGQGVAGGGAVGALSASGAAGGAATAGGAAGGSWLLGAGPLGAKLAVGCVLALGVGAGCVALRAGSDARAHHRRAHASARAHGDARRSADAAGLDGATRGERASQIATEGAPIQHVSQPAATASSRASHEFGLERQGAGAATAQPTVGSTHGSASASAASSSRAPVQAGEVESQRSSSPAPAQPAAGDAAAAAREFGPG